MSVIILNGTSSAGKSTLAAELQGKLTEAGECWLVMSQDDFFAKIPRAFLRYGTMHVGSFAEQGVSLAIVDGVLTRRVGPVGERLLDAYRAAIAATARAGVNVIVDEVLVDQSDWDSWLRHLDGLDVQWVGVRAALEEVERRERGRADRFNGLARAEYDQVHRYANYHTEVDTSVLDPSAAAEPSSQDGAATYGGVGDNEWIVLGPGEGRSFWTSVSNATVKVSSGEADFSVFESSPPPGVPGPPPHVHRSYDEAWYILDGEMEFSIAGVTETVSTGGFAFVPRGVAHSFRNASSEPARMLVIGSPKAQAMVEELGELVGHGGPPNRDAVAALFARYDSQLVAPPQA